MNYLIQLFNQIFDGKFFGIKKAITFEQIIGYNDINRIFNNVIFSRMPVHFLLVGPPGSRKTMFLLEINRLFEASLFVVGSNTTKAGLVNQLFERKPKFLLIDELEKMHKTDQTALLHLMETGIIAETKMNKTRQMLLNALVFATANSCEKISESLLSRFVVFQIPEYTFEEFAKIVVIQLKIENVNENTAWDIAYKVWNELGSRDIRDTLKVGRLGSNIQEVQSVISMMKSFQKKS